MKISYDKATDALYLHLADRMSVDSDEVANGIVLDSDGNGVAVGIDTSKPAKPSGRRTRPCNPPTSAQMMCYKFVCLPSPWREWCRLTGMPI